VRAAAIEQSLMMMMIGSWFSFVLVIIIIIVFSLCSTCAQKQALGFTFDLRAKNQYVVWVNVSNGLTLHNRTDNHDGLRVSTAAADVQNHLFYYLNGIFQEFTTLNYLNGSSSKLTALPGIWQSNMGLFYDAALSKLFGFFFTTQGVVGQINPSNGDVSVVSKFSLPSVIGDSYCYDATNHRYFLNSEKLSNANLLVVVSVTNGSVHELPMNSSISQVQYDSVTNSIFGFDYNDSFVQVNVNTGAMTVRIPYSNMHGIPSDYTQVIDSSARKFYVQLIDGEKTLWLTIDLSTWQQTVQPTTPVTYDHLVLTS